MRIERGNCTLDRLDVTQTGGAYRRALKVLGEECLVKWGDYETDHVPVVNAVFVSRYDGGTPRVAEPEEVVSVGWYSIEEALDHPALQPWTERHLRAVDERRETLGW